MTRDELRAEVADAVGYRVGISDAACDLFLAHPDVKAKRIIGLLNERLALHWQWDIDCPHRLTRNAQMVLRELRNRGGENRAAQALEDATRRGLPLDQAKALAIAELPGLSDVGKSPR